MGQQPNGRSTTIHTYLLQCKHGHSYSGHGVTLESIRWCYDEEVKSLKDSRYFSYQLGQWYVLVSSKERYVHAFDIEYDPMTQRYQSHQTTHEFWQWASGVADIEAPNPLVAMRSRTISQLSWGSYDAYCPLSTKCAAAKFEKIQSMHLSMSSYCQLDDVKGMVSWKSLIMWPMRRWEPPGRSTKEAVAGEEYGDWRDLATCAGGQASQIVTLVKNEYRP